MKKIGLMFLVIGTVVTQSFAAEPMIPLAKYVSQDNHEAGYVLDRCAALFLQFSGRARNLPQSEALNSLSEKYFELGLMSYMGLADPGTTMEIAAKEYLVSLEKIAKNYGAALDDNYMKEGHRVNGNELIEDDTAVCGEVLSRLSSKN